MSNSSKAKTNLACHLCDAVLGSAKNLRRHKKTVHNLHAPIAAVRVKCNDCLEEFNSVAETIQHIEIDHFKSANKHCAICRTVFMSLEKYQSHKNNRHGLPVWDSDAGSTSTSGGGGGGSNETIAIESSSTTRVPQSTRSILTESQTPFNGNLKKYQLNFDENEIDLLDFMMRNKEVIDDFIFEHSLNGSIKVQFSVEVSLMKHPTVENDEEPNVEKITLFLNTEMVRVNYGGLEEGQYIEMIEHMLNSINCFASHGSGCIIERISKVIMNFAKLSPMRAGSYLPLPLGLKKQNFNFVNIETKTNDRCFLYCFIAAYHLKHGPPLHASSQAYRKKTKCATYKEEDSEDEDSDDDEVKGESDKDVVVVTVNDNQDEGNAEEPSQRQPDARQREMKQIVKIQGDFEMPMSILETGRFERLNNVQINVFR